MKKAALFISIVLLMACSNQQKEQQSSSEASSKQITNEADNSETFRNNFAIVWKWNAKDRQLIEENISDISLEMTELWVKDIIENAYFNQDIDKDEYFPNISCFLKAKSIEEAESILDSLILVEKEIADYTIYPVGPKWLGRNSKSNAEKTKSFVSVWTTSNEIKPDAALIQSQFDALLKLWNEKTIENVYFDVEGTKETNNVTDFVFLINANSAEEAKAICESLPFTQNKISSYKLQDVGVFWLGEQEK